MQRYANLNGNSGVVAHEIDSDSISVKFIDGALYLYTYESAGAANIEQMKTLALRGQGLSSFISTTVRDAYSSKSG